MKRTYAFTLIELLVVIAIISLLVSILLPSLNQAREIAKSTVCKTHLQQIGVAMQLYGHESNGYIPSWALKSTGEHWEMEKSKVPSGWIHLGLLFSLKFAEMPSLFICPNQAESPIIKQYGFGENSYNWGNAGYWYFAGSPKYFQRDNLENYSQESVIVTDYDPFNAYTGISNLYPDLHHTDGDNVLNLGGGVKCISKNALDGFAWQWSMLDEY